MKAGRLWLRNALDKEALGRLDELAALGSKPGARLSADQNALSGVTNAISQIDPAYRPVRVVAFNKSAASNWGVPWHQDRIIAVHEKYDLSGYRNWSEKAGVWHCEPPLEVLQNMLFVRVHLDDTHEENGAMEIALNSHRRGAIAAGEAAEVANGLEKELCSAKRGDILVLNMLTLHRSRPAAKASSRRVLRVDYAAQALPAPLSWIV
tara:strand:+ start:466 stop:1089 length:624 start_codon:yes stop_codon:yes gene_type:complete